MTSDLEKLPEEPDSEKSILHIGGLNAVKTELIPTAIQYAALGHLHKFQSVDKKVFYCGSPLQYSMSEANQEKYAVIVDLDPDYKFKIEKIKLKSGFKIYRKTFNDVDKAVEWLKMNRNCYVELTFVLSKYLDAEDRKKINEAHQKIVNIIFEISDSSAINKLKNINAVENEEIEVLFRKYFKFKNKVEPDEELLELFKVIVEDGELVL
jgi:exonuclease SbcD